MARISYRVETQRGEGWRSEGLFDDLAMAKAHADQFEGASSIANVRVVAESDAGAKRDLVYDLKEGVDRISGGGAPAAAPAPGEAEAPAEQKAAPSLSHGQVIAVVSGLSVAALILAFLLIHLVDPLG